MNNQVANRPKMSFTQFMGADVVQKRAIQILGEKKALSFTSSIISAVQMNPGLQECEPKSIFNAALLGESLNLSPSPQLGQYYLVPFNVKTGVDEKGKPVPGTEEYYSCERSEAERDLRGYGEDCKCDCGYAEYRSYDSGACGIRYCSQRD